jgi:hypothetical protein
MRAPARGFRGPALRPRNDGCDWERAAIYGIYAQKVIYAEVCH